MQNFVIAGKDGTIMDAEGARIMGIPDKYDAQNDAECVQYDGVPDFDDCIIAEIDTREEGRKEYPESQQIVIYIKSDEQVIVREGATFIDSSECRPDG